MEVLLLSHEEIYQNFCYLLNLASSQVQLRWIFSYELVSNACFNFLHNYFKRFMSSNDYGHSRNVLQSCLLQTVKNNMNGNKKDYRRFDLLLCLYNVQRFIKFVFLSRFILINNII